WHRSNSVGDRFWQREFEGAFLYEETPDQMRAIIQTQGDMESDKPMDRLICGDVGFGKTEVAIRAIFKSAMGGKQSALLAPTTVLAQQHYQTLSERYADYPIRVELLSRFKTPKEISKIIEGVKAGSIDVVVGTHRLISGDVLFKDLGLVVVDEEQRFGVKQKEKFKELFRLVDILTLSATPIPRTLYQALTGMRDMSTIETPPPMRHSVETIVCGYDERVIREAIQRELKRQGQIYFLHNRVKTIEEMKERLQMIAPNARIVIGHGQMDKSDLEEVMHAFVNGKADILLSTTIIESGIDIPNANTIIIDRADRFGLADLYQLRGRVGRSHHKAYAYLLLPRDWMGTGEAKKRVSAIKQYAELGAGFKIAMRDLEIRGAGNVLGTAQSGHITSIGFELYCQLLKTAVSQIKGEKVLLSIDCKLDLDFITLHEGAIAEGKSPAYLTADYMKETSWRIEGYRKLADLGSIPEWTSLREEWNDRFGPIPDSVELLLKIHELKILASQREIRLIQTQAGKIILKRNDDYVMVGGKFPRLTTLEALSRVRELKQWIESFEPRLF
ncbi:MAG: DEAD/DEAH box helicase, partial [Verrucomicrobiota bacterium]